MNLADTVSTMTTVKTIESQLEQNRQLLSEWQARRKKADDTVLALVTIINEQEKLVATLRACTSSTGSDSEAVDSTEETIGKLPWKDIVEKYVSEQPDATAHIEAILKILADSGRSVKQDSLSSMLSRWYNKENGPLAPVDGRKGLWRIKK